MTPRDYLILFGVLGVVLAFMIYRAWAARRAEEREMEEEAGEEEVYSLVFLLRRPRVVTVTTLAAAAERAYGRPFNRSQRDMVSQTGRPEQFLVKMGDHLLGVINVTGTYVEDIGKAADEYKEFAVKKAMQDHSAWISVDLVGETPLDGGAEAYKRIGKLMAELAGPDCLALYCTSTQQINGYSKAMAAALRSDNPLSALTLPPEDVVVEVENEDARLMEAVSLARERWPEFVEAFAKKREKQSFAVKVPFHDGNPKDCEYMWVEVEAIDDPTIRGTLVNKPDYVKSVKHKDKVEVKVNDVQDWIYSDGAKMVGGFSAKVLEEVEREAQAAEKRLREFGPR